MRRRCARAHLWRPGVSPVLSRLTPACSGCTSIYRISGVFSRPLSDRTREGEASRGKSEPMSFSTDRQRLARQGLRPLVEAEEAEEADCLLRSTQMSVCGMEMSPQAESESDGGSPYRRADIKRERDDEAENLGAMPRPRSAKMEMTPCRTPIQSPNTYGAARMCLTTPLCSTPVSSMCLVQRSELGLRWGSAYSPGPRRWPRCLVPSLISALLTQRPETRHKRALDLRA